MLSRCASVRFTRFRLYTSLKDNECCENCWIYNMESVIRNFWALKRKSYSYGKIVLFYAIFGLRGAFMNATPI